jgi:hypothetical protein
MGSFDMNDTYVILTGSKNNAGDYFIKYRAKQLFKALRPDRTIIDYDAWKSFTPQQLEEVNRSKALILMGGPALQSRMRPDIYRMVDELDKIRVPIIAMGLGWKSAEGDWNATHSYELSDGSIELLHRIENSGYLSSVRDYSTLNTLFAKGFSQYMMTGCPGLYELDHIGKPTSFPDSLNKISFSMGARFAHSPSMYRSSQVLLGKLQKYFAEKNFRVVFHHSVGREYLTTDHSNQQFWQAHQNMIEWLERQRIPYVDISGSAENLVNHYSGECLHIGFRVHAHIFMNSISKPTILLNEDGRGKALKDVIGGFSLDSYSIKNKNFPCNVLRKLGIPLDMYGTNEYLPEDLINQLAYERKNHYPRLSLSRLAIDRHFKVMKAFIEQLP